MNVRLIATLPLLAGLSLLSPVFGGDDTPPAPNAPDAPKPADKPDAGGVKEKKKGDGHAAHAEGLLTVILDHAADLSLTDAQKDSLQKLKADTDAALEKIKSDPEVANLQAQIKQAKAGGDHDKLKSLHKELKDLQEKKGQDPVTISKAAEAILTPDQIAKVKDLDKDSHVAKAEKKADKSDKKAPAAATPPADTKPAETAAKTDTPPAAPDNGGMGMDK